VQKCQHAFVHAQCFTSQVSEPALRFASQAALIASGNAYGARPLRRWLEQNIITEMSRLIVAGERNMKQGTKNSVSVSLELMGCQSP